MVGHFTLHVCPWGHRGSQEGRWPQGAQHSASSPGYFLPEPFPPPVHTQWGFCLKCLSSGFPRKWNEELSLSAKLWCYLLHSEGCCCCCSVTKSCPTLLTSWTTASQTLSSTISWSLLKFMSIESVMLSSHLILCRPLLLLPSVFASIKAFTSENAMNAFSNEMRGSISQFDMPLQ